MEEVSGQRGGAEHLDEAHRRRVAPPSRNTQLQPEQDQREQAHLRPAAGGVRRIRHPELMRRIGALEPRRCDPDGDAGARKAQEPQGRPARSFLRGGRADRSAQVHVPGPGQQRKDGGRTRVEDAIPRQPQRFQERRDAERNRRQQERGPAQGAGTGREREKDRQRDQQREADALEDVHAEDPARLAEDREPHPVHQRPDQQHLAEAPQRLQHPAPPRLRSSRLGRGANLRQGHGEPGGEDEGRRDQPVHPLQRIEERAGAQLLAEQRERVRLDHQHDGEPAQPVDGADARVRIARHARNRSRLLEPGKRSHPDAGDVGERPTACRRT